MTTPKPTVRRFGWHWWIVGDVAGPIGPYNTKADGEEDLRGIRRFDKYEDEPGYVTSDSLRKGED